MTVSAGSTPVESFSYRNGALHVEGVALSALAERYGTPAFVYSRAAIEASWHTCVQAFAGRDTLICYSVKANGNLAILNLLARLGAGFDIVSAGELQRVIAAGGDPARVVFSGVGKRADEIRLALEAGILCFNVESEAELLRLNEIAGQLSVRAPVSMRVNPDIDAATHPFISTGQRHNKFGVDYAQALAVYQQAQGLDHVTPVGIDCHIGSQITALEPYINALERLMALVEQLERQGIAIRHVDIGGGFGIDYRFGGTIQEAGEEPMQEAGNGQAELPGMADFAALIKARVPASCGIMLEPGRSIIGNAGLLLTRVEYLKTNAGKHFAVVDAAMNDLLRPSLYQAWHDIIPVIRRTDDAQMDYDVVGPVCESGDFLGLQRSLSLRADDLLAVLSAGAYGFCMSSNYNSRPRVAELLVDGEHEHVIRARETVAQLMAGEKILPE